MDNQPTAPASLSQVDYLKKKLELTEQRIHEVEESRLLSGTELVELFYQRGKLYSELELMKRVPSYE